MQILSVSLSNFKTHQDRHFQFQPGTNAICGENGAGKTSILEAIAWVLFGYQGDYAKEDLIRNGSSSAQATVTFISSRDHRTYQVQRCTQRGYTLFDPQLDARLPYTRLQDEVMPWLRQHLGVSPGTDLPKLFARTIGVPQGTFTADFLRAAEGRKSIFDTILKVEEYKSVHSQLNTLRRYAEDRSDAMKQQVAQLDEQLEQQAPLQQRTAALAEALIADTQLLQQLQQQLAELSTQRQRLLTQRQQLEALQRQRQELQAQHQAQSQGLERLRQTLQQAQAAVALCATHRSAYEAYGRIEAELTERQEKRQARQGVVARQQQLQQKQRAASAELTRLSLKLESFERAEAKLEELTPQLEVQRELEAQLQEHQQRMHQQQALEQQLSQQRQQIAQLQSQAGALEQTLAQLQTLEAAVAEISDIEESCDRIYQQLSRIDAARQFQQELQQLVAGSEQQRLHHEQQTATALDTLRQLQQSIPLLGSEATTSLEQTLSDGLQLNQQLIDSLTAILADLDAQTDRPQLQRQLQHQRQQLKTRHQQQAQLAQRPQLQQQWQALQQQRQSLEAQAAKLQQQLATAPQLEQQIDALQQQLQALGNPQGQCQLLRQSLADNAQIAAQHAQQLAHQQELEASLEAVNQELAQFEDLDQQLQQLQQERQQHQPGYTQFLQHQQLAQQAQPLAQEVAEAQAQQHTLAQQLTEIQTAEVTAQQQFQPEALAELEATYQQQRSQADRLEGSLPERRRQLQELEQQLQALEAVGEKRQQAEAERKRCDRNRRFVNFARKAYKEAGPRITEQYVHSISREADRLFRELINRPNVALTWTRDYEILVQEGPHQRRFLNLSGGEQMCAALAVRLALLKVLADIDVAFFDEPTTNMDRPRRESLAEAIGRLKSFQQVFVISHDDTFEKATENVVVVEREP